MSEDGIHNEDFLKQLSQLDAAELFLEDLESAIDGRGTFVACIGGTKTSDIDGISAAGADGESRRLTPAIDAEALVSGAPISCDRLPVSPKGIVSPVVISRACLSQLNCPSLIVNCGAFHKPAVDHRDAGGKPAEPVCSGAALPTDVVKHLFQYGKRLGSLLSKTSDYLVVAECVPGGTTTALAVLLGLGFESNGLVSSSMPDGAQDVRQEHVLEGLMKAGIHGRSEPVLGSVALDVVAAVGDPMQPVAAGIALGSTVPTLLGGGSQMLAVYAVASAIAEFDPLSHVAVMTTKWVAFDGKANVPQLARNVGAPLLAACPDFNQSRHNGLRAYEDGNVKEGMGAGASLGLAYLAGMSDKEIMRLIDATYDAMVKP